MPRRPPSVEDLAAAASLRRAGEERVFVVHGRDEGAKLRLVRFLEKVGLEPVVLHEKPGGGRPMIEKFSDYADVAFAIVLLTPDDEGRLAEESQPLRPRARQNVLVELGFFLGKLGTSRVCALCGPTVDVPSDFEGLLRIRMDDADAWQLPLARELKHAGLRVDLNAAL